MIRDAESVNTNTDIRPQTEERGARLEILETNHSVDDSVPIAHPLNPVDLGMENDDNMFTPTGRNVNNISS